MLYNNDFDVDDDEDDDDDNGDNILKFSVKT